MRGWIVGGASLVLALLGGVADARADATPHVLQELADLHRACRTEPNGRRHALYAVDVGPGGWSFGSYERSARMLPLAVRRNLRAFGGAAELFPARMESVGFVAGPNRARVLAGLEGAGAALRVGFFLGFDDPVSTRCLVRPAAGVTTVRMDIAFIEVIDGDGRLIAREDTDRLRAWLDDLERDGIAGTGPRGEARAPMLVGGRVVTPAAWIETFGAANRAELGRALAQCHADGIERGAEGTGQVVVRLVVDPQTGRVEQRELELSSLDDRREAQCIVDAVGAVVLPPATVTTPRAALSVPVHLDH